MKEFEFDDIEISDEKDVVNEEKPQTKECLILQRKALNKELLFCSTSLNHLPYILYRN